MHLKDGTDDELLVVGVLFDVSEYGTNVEVRVARDFLRLCRLFGQLVKNSTCISGGSRIPGPPEKDVEISDHHTLL